MYARATTARAGQAMPGRARGVRGKDACLTAAQKDY